LISVAETKESTLAQDFDRIREEWFNRRCDAFAVCKSPRNDHQSEMSDRLWKGSWR